MPDDVVARLQNISRVRGQSLNTTVIQILADAVGPEQRMGRLLRYATWSKEDLAEFSEALARQRTVDAALDREDQARLEDALRLDHEANVAFSSSVSAVSSLVNRGHSEPSD